MSGARVDHDRLFKELITTFFEEFMMLFFPNAYEHIDFKELRFLSQEIFTDVTEGEKHVVDLLVETKLKGEESLVIIHVEPQSSPQKNFNERMFIYFSRIFQKYRRKILPIAIFSFDAPRDEPNSIELDFSFAKVLSFNYQTIELKKQNWRTYLREENPVAAALLSKMGYTDDERIEVKKEFFRILIRLELDKAKESLITGFFESYLKLNEEEERQFKEEVHAMNPKESEKIMEIITSYEKKGREQGMEQGMELKSIEVAIRMLEKNMLVDEIAEITGLSLEKVESLKRN
ncbi:MULTISPECIES: Rpn family recombination-promoting nuclease/putative transposase [Bacillaceae]|uniref:Rpn family recombination-promoting nuclease/putative transposase n=1 Tax=Evansella alkalicola TaxID=745819 RepID=A0ABS6K061_9BACI|nr:MULTISPECIES: Rpn family recombination-promoting nuclease/putative transposase [Bacillaceae]MBU9724234.1 Rpn family recombination-promoting nuclease/putative transposase [Bacillus alkalicola]